MFGLLKNLLGGNIDELKKTVADVAASVPVKEEPKVETPKVEKKSEPKVEPKSKADPAILKLQQELIAKGAKIKADGIDGPATQAAKKQFAEKPVEKSTVVSKGSVTVDLLKQLFPKNKNLDPLSTALNAVLPEYDINTPERIACFLAQCGHESAGFTVLTENLNYSAEGLCKVWPKRFPTAAAAAPYNRNPEKIANKVYCDRLGNGKEASGDGWKYRGRGAIQLTGKSNYEAFAKSCGKTLDETVEYCETLEGAIASACYFWKTNNLNKFVDANDFVGLTKKINGGTVGLQDRTHHYEVAIKLLK